MAYEFTRVTPQSTQQYTKCELHAELITQVSLAAETTCHIEDTPAAAAAWLGAKLMFLSAKQGVSSTATAGGVSPELAALKTADLAATTAKAAYKEAANKEFALEVSLIGCPFS